MNIQLPQGALEQLKKHIEAELERQQNALVNQLGYIGEDAINQQKQVSKDLGFEDQTGNLRSSYGFRLVKNGKLVSEDGFEQILPTATEGVKKGKDFAKEIAGSAKEHTTLVLVAGMEYAGAVASKGRDVLDTAEIVTTRAVRSATRNLRK